MNSAHCSKSATSHRSATKASSTRPSVTMTCADGIDDRDVRPGAQLEVVDGLDVRCAHEVGAPRVDDDELGALAQPALHPGGEDRVGVGRVRADHHDARRPRRPRRSPACRPRCRRSASGRSRWGSGRPGRRCRRCCCRRRHGPSSARRRPPRWCSATSVIPPIELRPCRCLDRLQALGRRRDRLFPAHLAPVVVDRVANHRREDPVLVGRVPPGEASLHAGVPLVRPAVFVRHHPDELVASQLGLERAADAAVGARGEHGPLRRRRAR